MSDIVHVFTCNCNMGFNCKNKNTYRAHFKSNRHQAYEYESLKKNHIIEINKLQVKFNQLQVKYDDLSRAYYSACKIIIRKKKND